MNQALTGLKGTELYVYLDDIVVYSSTVEEHCQRLQHLFDSLKENGLTLQPDKCRFFMKEVAYLGHIINEDGIHPDPSKVKALVNMPTPLNQLGVRKFSGFSNYYRRFVENYTEKAEPLTLLLRKNTGFEWEKEQDEASNLLKIAITEDSLLSHPDMRAFRYNLDDLEVTLEGEPLEDDDVFNSPQPQNGLADAMIEAETLMEDEEKEENTTGIADENLQRFDRFISKLEEREKLDESRNQNTHDWDYYDVPPIFQLKKTGLGKEFRCQLDESSLLFDKKMAEYGDQSIQLTDLTDELQETSFPQAVEKANISPNGGETRISTGEGMSGIIRKTDEGLTRTAKDGNASLILESPHPPRENLQTSDQGWFLLARDEPRSGTFCQTCRLEKIRRVKFKQPMLITETPSECFDRVAINTVGPLPTTRNGNKHILTIHDSFAKHCIAVPLLDIKAHTIAQAFATHYVAQYGCPKVVLSDKGTSFVSKLFAQLSRILRFHHVTTSGYRPQSNGALERSHHVLVEYLKVHSQLCFKVNTMDHIDINEDVLPMSIGDLNKAIHPLQSNKANKRYSSGSVSTDVKCMMPTTDENDDKENFGH
ncbi:uncharacterized protein [Fopius arisanus]|uniref:RNA-directed DNA polymerase n=1 Tax=Fopius arisanus TaxID=64838 RepID=A0A9R1TLX2_9HYME|nr:PREDICTED: uncharacterized protein LOC105272668 [Fopius arisanus]